MVATPGLGALTLPRWGLFGTPRGSPFLVGSRSGVHCLPATIPKRITLVLVLAHWQGLELRSWVVTVGTFTNPEGLLT